ncbi:MAG TPA: hypothetical protein VK212_02025 [Lentimicrobium sp.]|nr:hypothetical protein [Lentimicrobium sp.]
MTPREFAELPIEKKVNLVLSEGEEVLDRIYMYYLVKLYAFKGLFIEIWYQQVTNRIDRIQLIEQEDVLHIYEKQIDLNDLFK